MRPFRMNLPMRAMAFAFVAPRSCSNRFTLDRAMIPLHPYFLEFDACPTDEVQNRKAAKASCPSQRSRTFEENDLLMSSTWGRDTGRGQLPLTPPFLPYQPAHTGRRSPLPVSLPWHQPRGVDARCFSFHPAHASRVGTP